MILFSFSYSIVLQLILFESLRLTFGAAVPSSVYLLRAAPPTDSWTKEATFIGWSTAVGVSSLVEEGPGVANWYEPNATLPANWQPVEFPVGYDKSQKQFGQKTTIMAPADWSTQHRIELNLTASQISLAKRFGWQLRAALDDQFVRKTELWINGHLASLNLVLSPPFTQHEAVI
jgi:hypothetical protein